MGAFHGMTSGSLAVTGNTAIREGIWGTSNNVTFMPYPYGFMTNFDTIDYIDSVLNDVNSGIEKPAAIILETVQAEGGIIVTSIEWMQRLRALCDRHDILLICDDIQVGCGRTGSFFSFERANIIPDLVVLSKSISGYGFPMSLLLIKPEIERVITGSDRAYTIYTSGSTGLPKGAIVRHDGAINHIYAQFDALELQPGFSFLQSAPASSDISVWQFLAPIFFGGKTVIVDKETICNPERLFKLIKKERLTLVELVPVVLSSLLDYISKLSPQKRSLPNLQCMIITGEYVAVELVNRWLNLYPEIKVANAYGPTEAADDITQYIITEPLPANLRNVPIGKPLANTNIYIVDSQMQLQPIDVPGEICVSGICVGDGYWQNEAKTTESFVDNPFVGAIRESPLLYKTGDLGRWLPDGNIEFLGRIDHQVKIRGFRLELGEIESILSQHPAVISSVAIAREDIPGDKRLVAYIVSDQDNLTDELPDILRNFLKTKLPEYSIPSTFILLDALPLTPSGKVDRRGLPALEIGRGNQEQSNILPRTPVEEVIAGVWSKVLKTDCVSVDDNFFERGGHSLLATQLISRLRQIFQIELPLRYVFEFPTVAELAQAVEEMKHFQQALATLPIVPVPRDGNLPLSFAQQGLWFIHQLNPELPIYNSPAAVRLTGSLNIPAFKTIVRTVLTKACKA